MTAPRIDLDELERLWTICNDGAFDADWNIFEDAAHDALPALLAAVRAAEAWWKMHKPVGWTEREHAQNPEVNCVGDTERALASVVATLAPFRKEKADD